MDKTTQPIECSFRDIANLPNKEFRKGRYSGSVYPEINDFGINKWVVLCYIDIDWQKIKLEKNLTCHEILYGCLKYLNIKMIYGSLSPFKADFVVKNGNSFIIVQLIINQSNNENFWSSSKFKKLIKSMKTGKK